MTKRGVVLGAGGVLGAAWTIGALHAVEAATGFDPREADVFVGTSAGSVLVAMLSCGIGVDTLVNQQRGIVSDRDPHIEVELDSVAGGALPPRPKLRLGSASLLATAALHPWKIPPLAALTAVLPQGRGSQAQLHSLVQAVMPAPHGWAPHPNTWVVAMDYDSGKRVPFGREGSPSTSLAKAVMASCSIPGWYEPVTIGSRRYVDGGACSPTSLDLVAGLHLDEVFVLSPMTSFEYDEPDSVAGKLERHLRRRVTRRLVREAVKVRAARAKVTILCPGREDLEAMGVNLMNPTRREKVLETSLRTSAAALVSGGSETGLRVAG